MDDIITQYETAEISGKASIPNLAIQAFELNVFGALGYPFRISSEKEIWRYHDVMHEGRFEANLRLIQELDPDLDLVRKTAKQILNFSEQHLPFRSCGKHALTRALYQFQLLMRNRPHDGKMKVLEIGPGSGYLGILLANDGHEYFAMDAAQAFYLYQKAIWTHIFQSDYFDYTQSTNRPTNAKITHLPWWRFANLSIALPEFDLVTVNHALVEMHENAVRLIFSRLREQWGSNSEKMIVADGLGHNLYDRKDQMLNAIQELGFTLDKPAKGVFVWIPASLKSGTETYSSPVATDSSELTTPRVVSQMKVRILKTFIGRLLVRVAGHQLHTHSNQVEELSLKIKELQEFLDALVPGEQTPDLQFLAYLNREIRA